MAEPLCHTACAGHSDVHLLALALAEAAKGDTEQAGCAAWLCGRRWSHGVLARGSDGGGCLGSRREASDKVLAGTAGGLGLAVQGAV
jgi:hypothetical protein